MQVYGGPPPPVEDNLYDLLEGIVARTPWKTEAEARRFAELLAKLRALNVFGYLASTTTVERPKEGR